jgi:hypothetical protein
LNEFPIPKDIFLAMLDRGAMTPGKDDSSFDINFAIVSKEFPSYLEFLVRSSLSSLEQWAYTEGYMAFSVMPDGRLLWKPTGKLYKE